MLTSFESSFKINNSRNIGWMNFKNLSNFLLAHFTGKITNFRNHVICDYFGRVKRSIFSNFIVHIVQMSSKKQMIWTNARRIIAFMTYDLILGNGTKMDLPRGPMGLNRSSLPKAFTDHPIAFNGGPGPNPASIGFVYFGPKSVVKCIANIHKYFLTYVNCGVK